MIDARQAERIRVAVGGLLAELRTMHQDAAWMARHNPVAYVALRRAERKAQPDPAQTEPPS